MSEVATPDVSTTEKVETIVDCDFHIWESPDDFLPYLEDPFQDMLTGAQPSDVVERTYRNFYPTPGMVSAAGRGKIQEDDVTTPDDVRRGMKKMGVDMISLHPTQQLFIGGVQHDELAAAAATAYNEWILDQFLDEDDGIYGPMVVAPQKPHVAAEEIEDRKDESAVTGIFLPPAGITSALGHDRFEPIYDAAQRAGLPIILHPTTSGIMFNFPVQYKQTSRYLTAHTIAGPMLFMYQFATMLVHGIPIRYPDLQFVIMEAGLGWIPFLVNRLDYFYYEEREDAPLLEKPPSEYAFHGDTFYFTSQPVEGTESAPEYVRNTVRAMNGGEHLLFSSDYPHHDFDHTDHLYGVLEDEFSAEDLENIYGRNALEVLNF